MAEQAAAKVRPSLACKSVRRRDARRHVRAYAQNRQHKATQLLQLCRAAKRLPHRALCSAAAPHAAAACGSTSALL
jgi:hypothetical protein